MRERERERGREGLGTSESSRRGRRRRKHEARFFEMMDGWGREDRQREGGSVCWIRRALWGPARSIPSRPLAEDLIGPFVAFESLAVSRQTAGR